MTEHNRDSGVSPRLLPDYVKLAEARMTVPCTCGHYPQDCSIPEHHRGRCERYGRGWETIDDNRKLIGPAHAHLDAPCTDKCYEKLPKRVCLLAGDGEHDCTDLTAEASCRYAPGATPYTRDSDVDLVIDAARKWTELLVKMHLQDSEVAVDAYRYQVQIEKAIDRLSL